MPRKTSLGMWFFLWAAVDFAPSCGGVATGGSIATGGMTNVATGGTASIAVGGVATGGSTTGPCRGLNEQWDNMYGCCAGLVPSYLGHGLIYCTQGAVYGCMQEGGDCALDVSCCPGLVCNTQTDTPNFGCCVPNATGTGGSGTGD
jgi:hypothetical protein